MLISRPQTIYISCTQTCTLCSKIASSIFALNFLPRLLAAIVNLALFIHEDKRITKNFNQVTGQMFTRSNLKGRIIVYYILRPENKHN